VALSGPQSRTRLISSTQIPLDTDTVIPLITRFAHLGLRPIVGPFCEQNTVGHGEEAGRVAGRSARSRARGMMRVAQRSCRSIHVETIWHAHRTPPHAADLDQLSRDRIGCRYACLSDHVHHDDAITSAGPTTTAIHDVVAKCHTRVKPIQNSDQSILTATRDGCPFPGRWRCAHYIRRCARPHLSLSPHPGSRVIHTTLLAIQVRRKRLSPRNRK